MKRILYLVKINEENTDVLRRDVGYIRKSLINQGHRVDVYDFKRRLYLSEDRVEEQRTSLKHLFLGKLGLLYNFFVFIRFMKAIRGKYDVVHIFSVRDEYLLVPGLLRKSAPKLIVSFYGSDVNYRNTIKNTFRRLYRLIDVASAANESFRNKVLETINIPGLAEKTHVLLLPQDHLDLYEGLDWEDKAKKKKELGISEDQVVIVVGSCIHLNEQHEPIVAAMKKLPNPEKYTLIFPFSSKWEDNSVLQEQMQELIKTELADFTTIIIPDYISHEQMRDIRFASDVFLNLRKHDQFNASMIECNYSLTEIITGSWLPYSDYLMKMEITVIDEIPSLLPALQGVLDKMPEERIEHLLRNRSVACEHYGHNVGKWMELYNE